jgi:glycosyltransferase involved in cell wall biosynthesis
MRIGIYANTRNLDDAFGGLEIFVARLTRSFAMAGHSVVVHLLASETAGLQLTRDGATAAGDLRPAYEGVSTFQPTNGPGIDGCIDENAQVTRSQGEDVILAFGTRDAFVYQVAMGAARACSVPVLSFLFCPLEERWFRSQLANRTRGIIGWASEVEQKEFYATAVETVREVVAGSDRVVVPTQYMRGQLAGLVGGRPPTNVRVIYHGVDPATVPGRRTPWDPADPWLHVSRLAFPEALSKNFLWSCQFLHRAHQEFPGVRLLVCGDGNGRTTIERYATDNDLTDALQIRGHVAPDAMLETFSTASLLLVPSMMEAGCQSVVEAVLAGCLPVALDYAGLAEVMMRLGLSDFLLPPRTVPFGPAGETVEPDMDQALELVRSLRSRADEVTERLDAARAVAVRELSIQVTVDQILCEVASLSSDLERVGHP